jgi:hypothetical protein
VAGGLTFLAVPFVVHWSSLDRVDMLGLALSWGGLYALVRRPDRRGVILAALLLVAAVYTRQTYALAAPLAARARGSWPAANGDTRSGWQPWPAGSACSSWASSTPLQRVGSTSTPSPPTPTTSGGSW